MLNNKFQKMYKAIVLQQQQQLDKHQHESQTSIMKIFNKYRDYISDKVPESNQDKCNQQLNNLADKLEANEEKLIKLAKENGKKIIKKYMQQKSENKENDQHENNQSTSYDFEGDSYNLAGRVIAALTLPDNAKYIRLFEQFKKATNDKELRQQLTDILNEIDDIKEDPEDYTQTIADIMSNENSHKLFKLVLNKYKRRKTSYKEDSSAKGLLD